MAVDDVVLIPEEAVAQAQAREMQELAMEVEESYEVEAAKPTFDTTSMETAICLICQHGFIWPTAYWPMQDEYGNWFHQGCSIQGRPYMAINQEEQWWSTAGPIWWEVYCEGK